MENTISKQEVPSNKVDAIELKEEKNTENQLLVDLIASKYTSSTAWSLQAIMSLLVFLAKGTDWIVDYANYFADIKTTIDQKRMIVVSNNGNYGLHLQMGVDIHTLLFTSDMIFLPNGNPEPKGPNPVSFFSCIGEPSIFLIAAAVRILKFEVEHSAKVENLLTKFIQNSYKFSSFRVEFSSCIKSYGVILDPATKEFTNLQNLQLMFAPNTNKKMDLSSPPVGMSAKCDDCSKKKWIRIQMIVLKDIQIANNSFAATLYCVPF